MGEQETAIAVLQEKVKFLESQLSALHLESRIRFDRIEEKLDAALEAIYSGRPSWSVSILLASLMTICSGLIVYLITHQ